MTSHWTTGVKGSVKYLTFWIEGKSTEIQCKINELNKITNKT